MLVTAIGKTCQRRGRNDCPRWFSDRDSCFRKSTAGSTRGSRFLGSKIGSPGFENRRRGFVSCALAADRGVDSRSRIDNFLEETNEIERESTVQSTEEPSSGSALYHRVRQPLTNATRLQSSLARTTPSSIDRHCNIPSAKCCSS